MSESELDPSKIPTPALEEFEKEFGPEFTQPDIDEYGNEILRPEQFGPALLGQVQERAGLQLTGRLLPEGSKVEFRPRSENERFEMGRAIFTAGRNGETEFTTYTRNEGLVYLSSGRITERGIRDFQAKPIDSRATDRVIKLDDDEQADLRQELTSLINSDEHDLVFTAREQKRRRK